MRRKSYFHGTSMDNFLKMKKEGFIAPQTKTNWKPSGDSHVYLWSPSELVKHNGIERAHAYEEAFRYAKDSGECALLRAKDCRIVVLQVLLDPASVDPDDSSPDLEGAVKHYGPIPIVAVKKVWVSKDLSLLRGYFMGGMLSNKLANLSLSPIEQKIAEIFAKSESFYPEDVDDIAELYYK